MMLPMGRLYHAACLHGVVGHVGYRQNLGHVLNFGWAQATGDAWAAASLKLDGTRA
jgi:hypothetical protein